MVLASGTSSGRSFQSEQEEERKDGGGNVEPALGGGGGGGALKSQITHTRPFLPLPL